LSWLISGGLLLDAGNIGRPIGWSASALAFPDHLTQAIHRFMVGQVQGVSSVRQQFKGLPDAARLVDAALFAD
jgi:hypothetical protein